VDGGVRAWFVNTEFAAVASREECGNVVIANRDGAPECEGIIAGNIIVFSSRCGKIATFYFFLVFDFTSLFFIVHC